MAYLTPRDDQITMVATALGVPDKGDELVSDIDAQFAQAEAAHPEFAGKTVTVAAYTADGWGATSPATPACSSCRISGS